MNIYPGVRGLALLAFLCGPAMAAPMLRLSTSALVWLPGGAATQTVYASNAGDGTLALSASVPSGNKWLTVTVGTPQTNPGDGRLSVPLLFTIDGSSLAWGTYTASVTVNDPHAIDSPQVVTATVLMNGGDPVAIDAYLAPGAQEAVPIYTGAGWGLCFGIPGSSCPSVTASTQDGGMWLAVSLDPMGTLYFTDTAYIHLAPPATMTPGTYSGSVAVNDYAIRTIPVTMRVTTQPIAVPSTPPDPLAIGGRRAGGGVPFPAADLSYEFRL